jgi:hypothetical protein
MILTRWNSQRPVVTTRPAGGACTVCAMDERAGTVTRIAGTVRVVAGTRREITAT